jgi:hypothetical protein
VAAGTVQRAIFPPKRMDICLTLVSVEKLVSV